MKVRALFTRLYSNTVLKNFSYLTFGNIITQLLGMIAVIRITHILSPAEYGIYTFLLAQSILLVVIGDLGVRNINIRTIARDNSKTKDLLINGIKLRFIVITVLCLLYLVYNYYLGSLDLFKILTLFLLSFATTIIDLLESITWGYQKMKISSIIGIIYSVVWLSIVYLLPSSFSINVLFLVYFILNCLKLPFFLWFFKKENMIQGEALPFISSAKRMIKEGLPYFLMVAMMLPTNHFSSNFLDINSTPQEIGYFNLAQKLIFPAQWDPKLGIHVT